MVQHHTDIEWTQRPGTTGETLNPTTGCDKISEGCNSCYAWTMAKRLKGMGSAKYQNDGNPVTSGPGFGLTMHPDVLRTPLGWRSPRTVFVNSMSDLFHAQVTKPFVVRMWDVMSRTPQHTYLILTKRPERMPRILGDLPDGLWQLPLPNVWLGTSIESDKYVSRADRLRETPAAVRFLSLEPLIGPLPTLDLTGIDWVIVGGETGVNARPIDLGWVRALIAQARGAGASVFVKQLGLVWAQANHVPGRRVDRKGNKMDRWPADLRIREFPDAPVVLAA